MHLPVFKVTTLSSQKGGLVPLFWSIIKNKPVLNCLTVMAEKLERNALFTQYIKDNVSFRVVIQWPSPPPLATCLLFLVNLERDDNNGRQNQGQYLLWYLDYFFAIEAKEKSLQRASRNETELFPTNKKKDNRDTLYVVGSLSFFSHHWHTNQSIFSFVLWLLQRLSTRSQM